MPHILIIDDDKSLTSTLKVWLESQQYTVSTANSGQDGLQALDQTTYDVVILDWTLPDLDGIEVLAAFRFKNSTTPVIMVTGRNDVDAKVSGLDCGANDYLTKPFNIKELSARLRTLLRHHPLPTSLAEPLPASNADVLKTANLIGTTLCTKYEFLSVLGSGAWGIVLKARHPFLHKLVAIKMLHPSRANDETIDRFHLEARAIGTFDHPNIVRIYDSGVTELRQPYMVMELVDGMPLEVMLEQHGYAPPALAVDIMAQICDGIAHAHDAGVIHRDLKPANIVLSKTRRGRFIPKLLDFGLARFAVLGNHLVQKETQQKTIVGSPLYMSPEVIRGEPADNRSDIYACGCMLFEMICGLPPISGMTMDEVLKKHVAGDRFSLSQVRPDLADLSELDRVIDTALQVDPAKRYQSALHLKVDLERLASTL
jgi:serine/threonine protein kinase